MERTGRCGDRPPTPVCDFRRETHGSFVRIADHSSRDRRADPVDPRHGPLTWRKSSCCKGGECVEIAILRGSVLIRDSKEPIRPVFHFTAKEWAAFLLGVKKGEFDVVLELWVPRRPGRSVIAARPLDARRGAHTRAPTRDKPQDRPLMYGRRRRRSAIAQAEVDPWQWQLSA